MTSTVLDLTVTPSMTQSFWASELALVLQRPDQWEVPFTYRRVSAGYPWPPLYQAFHSFFPLLQEDIINSLGHVSPFIYFFVCFFVFTET